MPASGDACPVPLGSCFHLTKSMMHMKSPFQNIGHARLQEHMLAKFPFWVPLSVRYAFPGPIGILLPSSWWSQALGIVRPSCPASRAMFCQVKSEPGDSFWQAIEAQGLAERLQWHKGCTWVSISIQGKHKGFAGKELKLSTPAVSGAAGLHISF